MEKISVAVDRVFDTRVFYFTVENDTGQSIKAKSYTVLFSDNTVRKNRIVATARIDVVDLNPGDIQRFTVRDDSALKNSPWMKHYITIEADTEKQKFTVGPYFILDDSKGYVPNLVSRITQFVRERPSYVVAMIAALLFWLNQPAIKGFFGVQHYEQYVNFAIFLFAGIPLALFLLFSFVGPVILSMLTNTRNGLTVTGTVSNGIAMLNVYDDRNVPTINWYRMSNFAIAILSITFGFLFSLEMLSYIRLSGSDLLAKFLKDQDYTGFVWSFLEEIGRRGFVIPFSDLKNMNLILRIVDYGILFSIPLVMTWLINLSVSLRKFIYFFIKGLMLWFLVYPLLWSTLTSWLFSRS